MRTRALSCTRYVLQSNRVYMHDAKSSYALLGYMARARLSCVIACSCLLALMKLNIVWADMCAHYQHMTLRYTMLVRAL